MQANCFHITRGGFYTMFIKIPKINKTNRPIDLKLIKAISLIIFLFLSGGMIAFIGFVKGEDIAFIMSRSSGANSWSTSNGLILGCMYVPVIMGVSLILLSILFSTILFANWIKRTKEL